MQLIGFMKDEFKVSMLFLKSLWTNVFWSMASNIYLKNISRIIAYIEIRKSLDIETYSCYIHDAK